MFSELNIYKGKKVFLTGHTGFKGAWLLKIFSILGAHVKGYSLAPTDNVNLYGIIHGDTLCQSVIADLRDRQKLANELTEFEPDFVFHLAAQPLVRLSYEIPSVTFEINAIGTANLLDAIILLNKPCNAVLITTDKVYYNNEWQYPYRENDRLGGYDPYSASKACAELVIDCYRNSFFNVKTYNKHKKAVAVGRAGNVIGGGDWSKDRLLPDICGALGNNREVIIRNPGSIRPWQHVLEPLIGYLKLGAKLNEDPVRYSQAYNFGPLAYDVLSVNEMVDMAINVWGSGSYSLDVNKQQFHEAKILKLDISKAIDELNWKPKLSAQVAVRKTIEWYKVFFNDIAQALPYTEQQILDFMAL